MFRVQDIWPSKVEMDLFIVGVQSGLTSYICYPADQKAMVILTKATSQ